jgi:hypothetical protein
MRHRQGTLPNASLAVFLPTGSVLRLGEVPVVVGPIDLLLASEGIGATLDAHHASRVLDVQSGATLQLQAITLTNGHSPDSAGAVRFSGRADMTLTDGSSIVNSHSASNGGAMLIPSGVAVTVANGSRIENSTAEGQGGAVRIEGGSLTVTQGSMIRNSSALHAGTMSVSSGIVRMLNGSWIADTSAQFFGAVFRIHVGATIEVDDCWIVNGTATNGGVFSLSGGGTVRVYRARIFNMKVASWGAVVLTSGTANVLVVASHIQNVTAGVGGVALLVDGTVTASGCMIRETFSRQGGGFVIVSSGLMTVTDGTSVLYGGGGTQFGGAFRIEKTTSTLIVANGSSIAGFTAEVGGAVSMTSGFFYMSNSSSLINCTASSTGGGIDITGGSIRITGCFLVNLSGADRAGFMNVLGGDSIIRDSVIRNSYSSGAGGAFDLPSGELTLSNTTVFNSTVWIDSAANVGGSFVAVSGGTFIVTNGSVISESVGHVGGGACEMKAGKMILSGHSRIERNFERAFVLAGGELYLEHAIVEHSEMAPPGNVGLIAFVPPGSSGNGPVFSATFTEFRQHDCTRPLFHQESPAQIMLRNITFTALGDCVPTPANFANFTTKGCGST